MRPSSRFLHNIVLAATFLLISNPGFAEDSDTSGKVKFVNSLGQRFVEIEGTPVLFCIWETRVQDFRAFSESSGRRRQSAGFSQSPSHPAVMVSWEDATQFCRWLTKREIASGKISESARYRLPTSEEWSLAVGLAPPKSDDTLSLVSGPSQKDFPWEGDWPPGENSGNYHPDLGCDSFPNTSPVGSFAANRFGIFDMGGNVWEWCANSYKNSIDFRVLRGASWRMRSPGDLLSSLEIGNVGHLRLNTYGFRVVLELGEKAGSENTAPED